MQRALLNQNRCNGTAAFFHLGFNNRTLGFTIRIGFQIQNFGLQQNCLNQLVEVNPLFGGNLGTQAFTAQFLNGNAVLQQSGLDLHRIGAGQVYFVNRYHNRHFRSLAHDG